MPNWCNNYVSVTGPKDLIDKLFGGNSFSFQKEIPCPRELQDLPSPAPEKLKKSNVKKYGHEDWYSWQVSTWGTKWDPGPLNGEVEELPDGKATFTCFFDSAWAPPVNGFRLITQKYPDLHINLEYVETGCSFFGVASGNFTDGFYDNYQEYTDADSFEQALKECPCSMAEDELVYLREREEEEKLNSSEDSDDKILTVEPATVITGKSVSSKKTTKKKTVKKVAVKKPTKKIAAKKATPKKTVKTTAKKAVKKSVKKKTIGS